MTDNQHTDAEIEAAWTKAIADQGRIVDAQRKLPAATAADANADLSAEDAMWKRALANVQGASA